MVIYIFLRVPEEDKLASSSTTSDVANGALFSGVVRLLSVILFVGNELVCRAGWHSFLPSRPSGRLGAHGYACPTAQPELTWRCC
jgi:hypothetical protein